jgi:transposase
VPRGGPAGELALGQLRHFAQHSTQCHSFRTVPSAAAISGPKSTTSEDSHDQQMSSASASKIFQFGWGRPDPKHCFSPGPGRDLLPGPRRDRLAGPAGRLPAAPDRLRPVPHHRRAARGVLHDHPGVSRRRVRRPVRLRRAQDLGPGRGIVKRPNQAKGFVLLHRRWVVERSFAWLTKFRRRPSSQTLSKCVVPTFDHFLLLTRLTRRPAQPVAEHHVVRPAPGPHADQPQVGLVAEVQFSERRPPR